MVLSRLQDTALVTMAAPKLPRPPTVEDSSNRNPPSHLIPAIPSSLQPVVTLEGEFLFQYLYWAPYLIVAYYQLFTCCPFCFLAMAVALSPTSSSRAAGMDNNPVVVEEEAEEVVDMVEVSRAAMEEEVAVSPVTEVRVRADMVVVVSSPAPMGSSPAIMPPRVMASSSSHSTVVDVSLRSPLQEGR